MRERNSKSFSFWTGFINNGLGKPHWARIGKYAFTTNRKLAYQRDEHLPWVGAYGTHTPGGFAGSASHGGFIWWFLWPWLCMGLLGNTSRLDRWHHLLGQALVRGFSQYRTYSGGHRDWLFHRMVSVGNGIAIGGMVVEHWSHLDTGCIPVDIEHDLFDEQIWSWYLNRLKTRWYFDGRRG